ncbi:MAG: nucleoside deaminase [Actinomycetota bacterium]
MTDLIDQQSSSDRKVRCPRATSAEHRSLTNVMSSTTGVDMAWVIDPADEAAMKLAITVAADALATHDVPVGAVVLDCDGHPLARAANRREADNDPTAHAEVIALRAASAMRKSWRLTDCTLVVTLEPCLMCAGAAMLARVSRIVFGAWDPKAGATGSIWDVTRDRQAMHRIEVMGGLLEDDCARLLTGFFADHRVQ